MENTTMNMKLEGTRFGTIEYEKEDVVTFIEGMIGFNNFREYVLITPKEGSPFRWIQSIDEPSLAFLAADPNRFMSDYAPEINDFEAKILGLKSDTPHLVYVTANIPAGKPKEATINLAAPIVINTDTQCAKQIILDSEMFPIRFPLFQEIPTSGVVPMDAGSKQGVAKPALAA
jgi:flagellar assembly factor FliW